MTKAPERVWVGPAVGPKGKPTWDFNGMCPGDCDNDPSGLQYAEHATEYLRSDLHAELMRASDSLAEAASEDLNAWPKQLVEGSSLKIALTAYKQAKEKTNAL